MKVGIMQPYFYPYIGYFQLINYVDKFVIYDEIKYTKKGWINRNRFLQNSEPEYFSISLKKDSDFLDINQRYLSDNWDKDKVKVLNQIKNAYKNAPYYTDVILLFEDCLNFSDTNLFNFIYYSLTKICAYLNIKTEIIISSSLNFNNELKSVEKVIDICKNLKAKEYINPIGGIELYDKTYFEKNQINLSFLNSNNVTYNQFNTTFIPYLSVLDVMMFNNKEEINKILNQGFELE